MSTLLKWHVRTLKIPEYLLLGPIGLLGTSIKNEYSYYLDPCPEPTWMFCSYMKILILCGLLNYNLLWQLEIFELSYIAIEVVCVWLYHVVNPYTGLQCSLLDKHLA